MTSSAGASTRPGALSSEDRDQPAGRVFALVLEATSTSSVSRERPCATATRTPRICTTTGWRCVAPGRSWTPATRVFPDGGAGAADRDGGPARRDDLAGARPGRAPERPGRFRWRRRGAYAWDRLPELRSRAAERSGATADDELARRARRRLLGGAAAPVADDGQRVPRRRHRAGSRRSAPRRRGGRRRWSWTAFRALRRQGRRARSAERDADWHRFRKRAEALRYLLVRVRGPVPAGRRSRRCCASWPSCRTGLGELQDHVAERRPDRDPPVCAPAATARCWPARSSTTCAAETPGARRACELAWDRFDRQKVRRHLKEALAARTVTT